MAVFPACAELAVCRRASRPGAGIQSRGASVHMDAASRCDVGECADGVASFVRRDDEPSAGGGGQVSGGRRVAYHQSQGDVSEGLRAELDGGGV